MQDLTPYKIIPVLVLNDITRAYMVADIALDYGFHALEITLRTPNALNIIERLKNRYNEKMILLAGTVLNNTQAQHAIDAGACYLVSPGVTNRLCDTMQPYHHQWFAGISTIGEAMLLKEYNITQAKLFPASLVGGCAWLKSVYSVFPHMRFFATGGITIDNANDFLAMPNIIHVGGTWFAPDNADESYIKANFKNASSILL